MRGAGAAPAETPRAEAPKAAVAPRAAAEPRKEAAGTQVVQRGDTLRKIAAETKPEGVSLEQMLVGLFRKNPDAFVGENINRLKTGAILAIPDKATVAAIPAAEAHKVYVAQAADWNAYRQRLATAAAAGPAKEAAAAQEAGGKITARVEDKAAPAEPAKDQVKVSRTEVPSKGVPGGKVSGASEEELIAKDKALKEAQERLALLEKNVGELQKLVDMKTQRLAELQQQAAGKKEEPKPVEAAKPAEPPKAAEAPKAVEPPKPAEAAPPVAARPAEPAPEPPKAVEAAKPAEPAPEPPKAAEAAKPAEEPKPAEVAKAPEVKPAETPAKPAAAGEPGLLASLLENPLSLVGGGGILALLAAYFLYRRREDGEAAALSTAAVPAPSSLGPNSVFRMSGGQSVDTGTASLQTGEFSQTGPGTIDTDEVDPVAEADVYMAYGRDAQAEEILIEALRKDPQRVAIHGKLLEIYANRKSVKQFDTLASELYAQTGGVGSEWEKVAVLGADLDPDNPLYSAAGGRTAPRQEPGPGTATVVLPAGALGAMAAATAGEALLPAGIEAEAGPGLQALAPEIWATSEVAPDVDEAADLALQPVESVDFDLGEAAGESVTAVESGPQFSPEGTLIMGIDAQTEDFSEPFAGIEDAATKVEEKRADAEAGLLDFELDIGGLGGETAVSPAALAEDSAGEAGTETIINPIPAAEIAVEDFDVNEISFEGAGIEEPAVPAAGFDMTSINLDLAAEAPAEDIYISLAPADGDDGQPADEVSTKLALARAYEEMGDHDQARELLEEVIAEGAGDLADQARQLLGRLRG